LIYMVKLVARARNRQDFFVGPFEV